MGYNKDYLFPYSEEMVIKRIEILRSMEKKEIIEKALSILKKKFQKNFGI